jgi:ribosome-associated protein
VATTRQLAVTCAKLCEDKKAANIIILDVRDLTYIADYFIVCSTNNERQARAITDELRVAMRELGLRELGVEGVNDARWILQDFGDLVIHIFHESQREFYDIEGLWADAKQVKWTRAPKKS